MRSSKLYAMQPAPPREDRLARCRLRPQIYYYNDNNNDTTTTNNNNNNAMNTII